MKLVQKKSMLWFLLLHLPLAALLLFATQPANAQTDPNATPEGGYPPPATPAFLENGYPLTQPTANAVEVDEAYVAPTVAAAATIPPAIVGENAPETAATPTLAISQSTLVRNRLILWAGFLVTLFIFGLAVYGAMLMYTRPRN
jgi:hypothetical protein